MSSPAHRVGTRSRRHRFPRYARLAITLTISAALVVAGAVLVLSGRHGHTAADPHPSPAATAAAVSTTSTTALPPTFLGPNGVEARWVIEENARAGTTAWQITGPKPPGSIGGFANRTDATPGQVVTLYVSTTAPSYQVTAYRIGYYGGTGGRQVWQSTVLPGIHQATCPVSPGIHMVSCDNWVPSLAVTITPAFVQGDYLFKLVGSGGQATYVPLTVIDPTSTATYLVKNDIYTWQAWNPYGGYDFYQGLGACPRGVYPICSRARVVSYDRPYDYGDGAADFLGNEYPLIRLMEEDGLDLTYVTDADVDATPSILTQHKVLLSLGHDECWSLGERQAAVAAQSQGVNIVFFAASPVLRHVRPQPSPMGPYREVVDYRDGAADPLFGKGNPLEVTGNTWSAPPANWTEVPFVGEAYAGFLEPGAPGVNFVVTDASAWPFQGTGLHDGSIIPALLQSDFDQVDPGESPANVQILAHSRVPLLHAQSQADARRGVAYSDMTYYTDPSSEGGVIDTGTNNWIPALLTATPLTKVTENILWQFGQGPSGRTEPSQSNWQQFY